MFISKSFYWEESACMCKYRRHFWTNKVNKLTHRQINTDLSTGTRSQVPKGYSISTRLKSVDLLVILTTLRVLSPEADASEVTVGYQETWRSVWTASWQDVCWGQSSNPLLGWAFLPSRELTFSSITLSKLSVDNFQLAATCNFYITSTNLILIQFYTSWKNIIYIYSPLEHKSLTNGKITYMSKNCFKTSLLSLNVWFV